MVTGPVSPGELQAPGYLLEGQHGLEHTVQEVPEHHCNNFFMQGVEEPTRKEVLLDLVLTNQKGVVKNVKAGNNLGCSDHEMVKFRCLCGGSKAMRRTMTPSFQRTNFDLFDLLKGIPWDGALGEKGVQET